MESRENQDKGYDGMDDNQESDFHTPFIADATAIVGGTPLAIIQNDPASDDYHYYRGGDYDDQGLSILERYKNIITHREIHQLQNHHLKHIQQLQLQFLKRKILMMILL